MCFVDLENAIYRVLSKVLEWTMSKERIPAVLVRSVMSLYEAAKTRVRVGMHQGLVMSPFLFGVWW